MEMNVASPRALAVSLGVGAALGVVAGAVFAVVFDKDLLYGMGAMLFLTGVIALVMGLLGAVEPAEGWVTGRSSRAEAERGRRSLAARVTSEHPALQDPTGWALAAWGVLVGGPLIGLSFLAFYLAG